MSRLVIVSNRLADPRKPSAGGLAVALGESLQRIGGLWLGWSGVVRQSQEENAPGLYDLRVRDVGGVTLAEMDLSETDHAAYYQGYANGVLWPVFHYRLDLARFDRSHLAGYRRVNMLFAKKLLGLLKPEDVIWVHDYHLIPLAAELRALGCRNRIGFFLHIPMPPPQVLAAIPEHEWLMRALFAYDLAGFQSETDLQHFAHYVEREGQASALGDGYFHAFGRTLMAASFPIGIDVAKFGRMAESKASREMYQRMREEYSRRQLIVGVDRLDYSKGLPERVRAFRELLIQYPENREHATLIQIASPSREDVEAYGAIRRNLEGLSGAINGDFGELDWMPIRYIHHTVARKRLPGLYRASRVALVTPLRDGMNLVAKEYIAAQDPADPGVLVLSRFTGAAEQLREALQVNPYDTCRTAHAIQQALHMPLEERRNRHQELLRRVNEQDLHWWSNRFIDSLRSVEQDVPRAMNKTRKTDRATVREPAPAICPRPAVRHDDADGPFLLADIGGTNVRFVIESASGQWLAHETVATADHASLEAALAEFLARVATKGLRHATFAVATPSSGDAVEMTNHPWAFSVEALRQRFNLETLLVVNDFVAVAMAIPGLQAHESVVIGDGRALAGDAIAVTGPGTGLGVAGLLSRDPGTGRHFLPIASEGGHASYAPMDAREERVVHFARERYGHVSAERLISGPGIELIYQALHGEPRKATAVAERANAGDPRSAEAMECFYSMLGSFAGTVALMFACRGGLYIAGGIVPANLGLLERSQFRQRFEAKGRYAGWLERIPTLVITARHPGIRGASALLQQHLLGSPAHAIASGAP